MNHAHSSVVSSHALRGMALMVMGGLFNVSMLSIVKFLSAELHPFQIGFFRCAIGLAVLLPFIWRPGETRPWHTRRLGLHGLRALLNAIAMLTFFWAASLSSLATVSALNFTAPLFATVLAVFFLGEKVGLPQWVTLLVGFCGTIIILRPDMGTIEPGALIALFSSGAWAFALITIKRLTLTDSPTTITFWASTLMGLFAAVPAVFVWAWPSGSQWLWLLAIGALGTLMQICVAKAFSLASATIILPFDFSKLIWATVLGLVIFGERIDLFTWIGGTVIFFSSVYSARRTQVLQSPAGRKIDET